MIIAQQKPIEELLEMIKRQCEFEMVEEFRREVEEAEAVLSIACGIGVQTMAQHYPDKIIYPGLNTSFLGMPEEHGTFVERCAACGNCILHLTGGICPVARCSKSLLNGPCGGSSNGKCEINKEIDCAWQLIYDRMKALGQLDRLEEIIPPKSWRTSRDGGPRKIMREDIKK